MSVFMGRSVIERSMPETTSHLVTLSPTQRDEREFRTARFAMRLSLAVGVLMRLGKTTVYYMTGSAAILSDFAESVGGARHRGGVCGIQPALEHQARGSDISVRVRAHHFFSAGFEGAMIAVAAIWILVEAIEKWLARLPLEHLGSGALLLLAAGLLNTWLGWYLLRVGKRSHSLILEADGKHVLTDSFTSFGVVAGLGLVILTGWKLFDPLMAIAVALNILWSGGRLHGARPWDYSTTPILTLANRFAKSWTRSAAN